MGRMKGLAAILGVGVLMVVVAGCDSRSSEMKMTRGFARVFGVSAVLVALIAACGGDQRASSSTPTAVPELTVLCAVTEAFSMEIPMLVARGRETIPSGFDRVNVAQCEFSVPIDVVVLELSSAGTVAAQHTISLGPQSTLSFPLPEALGALASAHVEPGLYDRRIEVATTDGRKKDVRNDRDAVYVVDLPPEGAEFARQGMIAARQALAGEQSLPLVAPELVVLEAAEWNDASLGCPEPDRTYAQVITRGFSFRFEHEGQPYKYHTDRDGTLVVECEASG